MSAQTHISRGELTNRFSYHPADTQEKKDKHEAVRAVCLEAADSVVELTGPPTREQSLAITKFEEAMFWANAAIARNP
jgi:hypothetical protein